MKKFHCFIIFFVLATALTTIPSIVWAADHISLGTRYTYPIGNTTCDAVKFNSTIPEYNKIDPPSGKTIRQLVQEQLIKMHQNGVGVARLGVIAPRGTTGNQLPEPIRTNYIHFLQDVKSAGLGLVTSGSYGGFAPTSTTVSFDDATFEKSWSMYKDAHDLAIQYGPSDIIFGLAGEIAPSNLDPSQIRRDNMRRYATLIWQHYIDTYGNKNTYMSTIADYVDSNGYAVDNSKLKNLIQIYEDSGRGYPSSWDFSLYPPVKTHTGTLNNIRKSTYLTLQNIDRVLTQNNLSQPIGISETYYNDKDVAAGIQDFLAQSNRKIIFIWEWPLRVSDRLQDPNNQICVWPPFSVDAYKTLNAPFVPGDLNGDSHVDSTDYNMLLGNFGKTGTGTQGDIDNNGKVDIFDYNILVENFGK